MWKKETKEKETGIGKTKSDQHQAAMFKKMGQQMLMFNLSDAETIF